MKMPKGQRVRVTDLRNGTTWEGTVLRHDPDPGKVVVERDNGTLYRMSEGFVTLIPDTRANKEVSENE